MVFGSIYVVRNTVNNKVYVGQTIKELEKRWAQHKACANKPNPSKSISYLHRAMIAHGIDNFFIEVVETAALEELDAAEIRWIAYYDSTDSTKGYNLTYGGGRAVHTEASRKLMSEGKKGKYTGVNSPSYGRVKSDEERERSRQRAIGNTYHLGHKQTPEAREKMSLALKGRVQSPEERQMRSDAAKKGPENALYGKKLPAETRAKMSAKKLGTKRSAEVREAISKFHKGRKRSPETRERQRQAALARYQRARAEAV